jgi:hypothetical protein
MIIHVVTFQWTADTTDSAVAALSDALDRLATTIPELRGYRHGPDLGLRDGNADYAVVAVLDQPEDLKAYLDHPEHLRIVGAFVSPILRGRQAVQFTVGDVADVRLSS